MAAAYAVLSGAGISRGHPADLPLGDEFHDALLQGCFGAASAITGGAIGEDGLRRLIAGGRRNILGCIEDCLDAGTVGAVLDCLRVRLPTEEHLLCAMLAARGVLQLTLNFDNGIELAYALLTGERELPPDTPAAYGQALARWRAAMPAAPRLRVVSTLRQLAECDFHHRPLLVKLRGSVDVGTDSAVVPLRPMMEDLECTLLDDARRRALRAATAGGLLLVTGHSGRDLDIFETLETLLRPGGFDWVAPELESAIAARLRTIDPGQPRYGTARDALRAELGELPEWPSTPAGGLDFSQRFAAWWRSVPQPAAAEAYGRLLSEAGWHSDALRVLRAVAARPASPRAGTRARLRLADALASRGRPADVAEATALYASAWRDPAISRPLRAYAITRWTECRAGHAPSVPVLLTSAVSGATALLLAQLGPGRHRVSCRVLAGFGRVAVHFAEARLDRPPAVAAAGPPAVLAAWTAVSVLAWAWRRSTRAGTGTRQSDLELLRLRADLVLAALRGAAPAMDAAARLAAVERAYTHRGNRAGVIEVQVTRALLMLAARDGTGFARALSILRQNTDAIEVRPRTALDIARANIWARSLKIHPVSSGRWNNSALTMERD